MQLAFHEKNVEKDFFFFPVNSDYFIIPSIIQEID